MDKSIAVAFPLVLSMISSQLYIRYHSIFEKKSDSNEKTQDNLQDNLKEGIKYLVFSAIGILLTLWVLFKNI